MQILSRYKMVDADTDREYFTAIPPRNLSDGLEYCHVIAERHSVLVNKYTGEKRKGIFVLRYKVADWEEVDIAD